MGLWLATVSALAVGLFSAIWPASPGAVRAATARADEPVWRVLGLATLPFTLLSSVGWLMWWGETGDWRYGLIGGLPILTSAITVPITLYRRRKARRDPLAAARIIAERSGRRGSWADTFDETLRNRDGL